MSEVVCGGSGLTASETGQCTKQGFCFRDVSLLCSPFLKLINHMNSSEGTLKTNLMHPILNMARPTVGHKK